LKIFKIIEKTLFVIFAIFVSMTIVFALYLNKQKFEGINVVKYTRIRVEEPAKIDQIALSYAQPALKDRFISETKKLNSLNSTDYISNQTLIIPVFE